MLDRLCRYQVIRRWSGFGPVDDDAVAFHAAEPGHLAFGELVDGVGEEGTHLIVG